MKDGHFHRWDNDRAVDCVIVHCRLPASSPAQLFTNKNRNGFLAQAIISIYLAQVHFCPWSFGLRADSKLDL